jgi:hypothetical protein
MGPVAYGTERDRLLAATRGGRRWGGGNGGPPARAQGVRAGGDRQAVAVEAPEPLAVAVIAAPEPAEEPPAPAGAIPIQSAPEASAALVSVSIGEDVPTERLLGAIESVKSELAGHPGPLPVLLTISVAGASRQVRLPDRVAWDDRLGEAVRRAAGVSVAVELRPGLEERLA